jgi:hypothetical protein
VLAGVEPAAHERARALPHERARHICSHIRAHIGGGRRICAPEEVTYRITYRACGGHILDLGQLSVVSALQFA